jgi:anaerobic selenocysteine-containing dehydrogenase
VGAGAVTFGAGCVVDEQTLPQLLVLWGCNTLHTSSSIRRENLRTALINGMKLIVVDPKEIDIAKRADLWIRPRPGSDGALALGLLKILVEEKLYDKEYVANCTIGLDALESEIKNFSIEDIEKATWVPREQLYQFARMYSETRPGAIKAGNGLDGVLSTFQTYRAISIMRAITGNLNVPGGDVFMTFARFTNTGRFFLLKDSPRKSRTALSTEFKWADRSAYLPYHSLVRAILEEKPYGIKAAYFTVTNPLHTYPDSSSVYEALMKLEFMVVCELFMTPTAAIADIVLPAAMDSEHNTVGYWPGWYGELRAYPKIADPPGEAWSNEKILNELAKRLDLGEYFWKDEDEALEEMLKPSKISYEEFKERRILKGTAEYKTAEQGGIGTPSKKVEIYSKRLKEMGYEPVPTWNEVTRGIVRTSDEYPLLLTNAKEEAYVGAGYRNIAMLRKITPDPIVEVHPGTAKEYGLTEGEWICIETRKGRITQKLALNSSLDPRVVFVAFGWWFPEDPSNLCQWDKSNLNILTEGGPPYDMVTGGVQIKGLPCKIYKQTDG